MPAPRNPKKNTHASKKRRAIERQRTAPSASKTDFIAVQQSSTGTAGPVIQPSHHEKLLREATYPYLLPELKRIGILAISTLVILVILSIVLT